MRLAVIADIHGNLLALEAVIRDITARGIDHVVNLGDCVSGPLWPGETAERLRALGWPTVRGNHDRCVGEATERRSWSADVFAWQRLDAAQKEWLRDLPVTLELTHGVLACHARPTDDDAYLVEEVRDGVMTRAPLAEIRTRLQGTTADLILCGHSHQPGLLAVPGGPTIVNPGSVGCPGYTSKRPLHVFEAGAPHARYAVLTLSGATVTTAEFVAVEYDWHAAAAVAEANGSPEWAPILAMGFVHPA